MMQPGRFTELFFLDEVTALAAGHRPCALCRREDYNRFGKLGVAQHPGQVGADAIDAQLHTERIDPGTGRQLHHRAALSALPDGAFVLRGATPWLVRGGLLLRWEPGGYAARQPREDVEAVVLTPPSLLEVLRAGWDPFGTVVSPHR